jgi:hypothetical protein
MTQVYVEKVISDNAHDRVVADIIGMKGEQAAVRESYAGFREVRFPKAQGHVGHHQDSCQDEHHAGVLCHSYPCGHGNAQGEALCA